MRPVRRLLVALAALSITMAGIYVFARWERQPAFPAGLIQANGRLEGDEVVVAAKFAGRLRELCAREGDPVARGQVLARLDDVQTRARVEQAVQGEAAARAQWEAARASLAALELDVPLSTQVAEAGVARARATLANAETAAQQYSRDAARFRELASRGSLGVQKSEAADLASTVATRDIDVARASVLQAERQLSQAQLGGRRVDAMRHQVAALSAQFEQAHAVVADVNSVLADLTITAPIAGVITTRLSDVGEVVPAGAPIFNLVDLDRLYLKVYVAEPLIGKLRLGLPARIFTDAFPDRPFAATVGYIASRAEFTPKEVQSPDERVRLVYAVKLYLEANPEHRLSPGQPADAVIQHEKGSAWAPPRR
jgi:HlyD family secretion protein